MQIRTCAHACLRAHKQTRAALLDASPNPSLRLENTGEVRRQAMLCWATEAVKWCCWAYVLSGLVLTVFGVDEIYHKCHNHIINTMAPQPRLQEIWCGVIFEVSDEVNKQWNIIPKLVRQKYTDSWDIDKNNRKRERYEWWMGKYMLRMPTGTQEVHSHSPYSVCAFIYLSDAMSKKNQEHAVVLAAGLSHTCNAALQGNNSSFVNMCVCAR